MTVAPARGHGSGWNPATTVIDAVLPARNEVSTVAANVAAAAACRYVREVIVVDDGSRDGTADRASAAGAKVVELPDDGGSKAHAMAAGAAATDADLILFVDADCIGLDGDHLDRICEPVLAGAADLGIGFFDYGWMNWWVQRFPPLSGQRLVPRWVWDAIDPADLDGYTIELRINEVVAEGRHRTAVCTMAGVKHRTKRVKFGFRDGMRRTWSMYRDLVATVWPFGDIRLRTYWYYLRNLTVVG